MKHEDEIAMVRRHILQGERHVARQRKIVTGLMGLGSDTTIADQLLAQFESALLERRTKLARLTAA